MTSLPMKRGALIVFEALDRSGKSTQSRLLSQYLVKSKLYSFPNTATSSGAIINQNLSSLLPIPSQAMHLLFSANRWELQPLIINDIIKGNTVILDRYYHSGFEYSQANGLPKPWVCMADVGLPAPDHVFFMDINPTVTALRQDYGNQRHENINYQLEVQKHFYQLQQSNWTMLDANLPVDQLHEIIKNIFLRLQIPPIINVFAQ